MGGAGLGWTGRKPRRFNTGRTKEPSCVYPGPFLLRDADLHVEPRFRSWSSRIDPARGFGSPVIVQTGFPCPSSCEQSTAAPIVEHAYPDSVAFQTEPWHLALAAYATHLVPCNPPSRLHRAHCLPRSEPASLGLEERHAAPAVGFAPEARKFTELFQWQKDAGKKARDGRKSSLKSSRRTLGRWKAVGFLQ